MLPANYGVSGPAVLDTASENYGYLTVQICCTRQYMSRCWQVSNVLCLLECKTRFLTLNLVLTYVRSS